MLTDSLPAGPGPQSFTNHSGPGAGIRLGRRIRHGYGMV